MYPGPSGGLPGGSGAVVSSTYTPSSTPAVQPATASPSPPTPLSSSPEGFTPGYTPRYTPSYQPPSQGATPLYSGPSSSSPEGGGGGAEPPSPIYSPGNATPVATYSPAHYDPADVQETGAGYSPSGGPAYSPSAPYYSPANSPGYSPSSAGGLAMGSSPHQNYYSPHTPSYSPTQGGSGGGSGGPAGSVHSPGPLYSPGNATPATSQISNDSPPVAAVATTPSGYSPSIQGSEVTGNTTPHPGPTDDSPLSSPGPRYSWSGGSHQQLPSGRNTPQGATLPPAEIPVIVPSSPGGVGGSASAPGADSPVLPPDSGASPPAVEEEEEESPARSPSPPSAS